MQVSDNEEAIQMGSDYLFIVCVLSFGQVGYTIFERFLLATGKTLYSTIGQITGAVANIILDYVFIYPLKMGVKGAAYATAIGQCLSCLMDSICHYTLNKEVKFGFKDLKPNHETILGILKMGIPAAIMQGLLAIMMLGVNLILGALNTNRELLQGSFGIYYKIQQIPLFAAFGMSNALISIVSYNYGMKENDRVKETYKWGLIDTMIVGLAFTIIFEACSTPIASLFGMATGSSSSDIMNTVTLAIRIASVGFVFPLVFLFTLSSKATTLLWLSFPLSELLTAVISFFIGRSNLKKSLNQKAVQLTQEAN